MFEMQVNPFSCFDRDWALLTAGSLSSYNSMTISWGSMGTSWNKPIVTVYVRPDRYTWKFLQENELFTVSFYPEEQREALMKMGRLSGRDVDKAAAARLTPCAAGGSVSFREASRTLICRKIYMNQLNRSALPAEAAKIYQNGIEPHYLIMGEVLELRDLPENRD